MRVNRDDLIKLFKEGYSPEDIAYEFEIPYDGFKKMVSTMVKRLIKEYETQNAEILCNAFPEDPVIQSQKMKVLRLRGRTDEALEIGDRPEFKSINSIQSQALSVLRRVIQEKRKNKVPYNAEFQKARTIAESFPKDEIIQSKYINVLLESHKYTGALIIADRFKDNPFIQYQAMIAYIKDGRNQEAISIAERFPNSSDIQREARKLQDRIGIGNFIKSGGEDDYSYNNMDGTEMRKNIERIVRLSNPYEFINKKVPNWFDQVTLKAAILDYKRADTAAKKRLIQEIRGKEIDDPNLQESVRGLIAQIRKGSKIVDYDAYISLLKDSSKARFWRNLSSTLDDWEEDFER